MDETGENNKCKDCDPNKASANAGAEICNACNVGKGTAGQTGSARCSSCIARDARFPATPNASASFSKKVELTIGIAI